jgi:hypothetical protein
MNQTTPAIVAQDAVRRLPRAALLLLCLAYVLPGFVGRDPLKGADMASYGFMAELARGGSDWLSPQLSGLATPDGALLPYWLGAWAIQWAPAWLASDLAVRMVFALLLALTLTATWYASYYLARHPQAQPVTFAFGGEALLPDYARAMADGGLLAFIACLGLAQLSHETTPALAQLCFTSLSFFALAALPYRNSVPLLCAVLGLAGLTLSGAPTLSVLLGAGGALIYLLERAPESQALRAKTGAILGITVACAVLALRLDLWQWRIAVPRLSWTEWSSMGRLLLWFTWPAWPLALWTLWRWRHQLLQGRHASRHLLLPVWFAGVALLATLSTASGERSLLLALPALATLAAFALPTLKRSVSALIDWFTLLFFSSSAIIIWVIWIAMQTGVPSQPAANVARLAPGFQPGFSALPFVMAALATLAWAWLVKWRVGRHRSAIWKSLVLPAGGAALCFLLLMTLWLPLYNFTRSYAPLVQRTVALLGSADCLEMHGLSHGHIAAFQFHARLLVKPAGAKIGCRWLLVNKDDLRTLPAVTDLAAWTPHASLRHPADREEDLLLYQRK